MKMKLSDIVSGNRSGRVTTAARTISKLSRAAISELEYPAIYVQGGKWVRTGCKALRSRGYRQNARLIRPVYRWIPNV